MRKKNYQKDFYLNQLCFLCFCARFLLAIVCFHRILLRFYLFENVKKYEFVVCKQSKNNYVCLISVKLFIVHSVLCATIFNLFNNNYLFVILLCSHPFAQATTLVRDICVLEIFKPRLFALNARHLHTRLFKLLLLVHCFVFPFYSPQ